MSNRTMSLTRAMILMGAPVRNRELLGGAPFAIDPPTPIPGTTPTVYPGAVAIGQDEEALFNLWMNRYFDMPLARQQGETSRLGAKVRDGTATPLEERQFRFAKDLRLSDLEDKQQRGKITAEEMVEMAGLKAEGAGVPEVKLARGERVQVIEELRIKGEVPKMGIALVFLVGFGGLFALAMRGKK